MQQDNANLAGASTGSDEQAVTTHAQRMDPELKARWVAALRSGQYKQGHNFMFWDGGFCCLGVLAMESGASESDIHDRTGVLDTGSVTALDRLGWDCRQQLAVMNDHGKSFAEIADWIEANL